MSQAYNKLPSEVFGVYGAAGLFFDKGLMHFGRHVEGEVERASADAISPGFARSAQQRAFARCMGDDMSKSNAGYADPFGDGERPHIQGEADEYGEIIDSGY